MLTACVSSGEEPEVAHDPAVFGLDWRLLEPTGPFEVEDPPLRTGFSAAGYFWVIDNENSTIVHGTNDGVTWRQIDLAAHGVPAQARLVSGGIKCNSATRPIVRDDGMTLALYDGSPEYYEGSGRLHDVIFVDVTLVDDGDDDEFHVEVTPANGASEVPAPRSHPTRGTEFNFRAQCASSVVEVGDARYLFGRGDWWRPWETGRTDLFVSTSHSGEEWSMYATMDGTGPFENSSQLKLESPFVVAGEIGLVGWHRDLGIAGNAYVGGLTLWKSLDALDWRTVAMPSVNVNLDDFFGIDVFQAPSGDIFLYGVLSNKETSNAEPTPEPFVMHSVDGETWNTALLPHDTGRLLRPRIHALVATDYGYLAFGETLYRLEGEETENRALAWTSVDGQEWVEIDREVLAGTVLDRAASSIHTVIPHDRGLVNLVRTRIWVSGLPWGEVEESS